MERRVARREEGVAVRPRGSKTPAYAFSACHTTPPPPPAARPRPHTPALPGQAPSAPDTATDAATDAAQEEAE